MKHLFLTTAFLIATVFPALAFPVVLNEKTGTPVVVQAAKPSDAQVAQRERMKACNKGWSIYKKEHELKGKDRKKYLSDCLSGAIEPPVKPVDPADPVEPVPRRHR